MGHSVDHTQLDPKLGHYIFVCITPSTSRHRSSCEDGKNLVSAFYLLGTYDHEEAMTFMGVQHPDQSICSDPSTDTTMPWQHR